MIGKESFDRLGGLVPFVGGKFAPLDPEEINKLERDFAIRLPDNYRAFLETFGAIRFGESVDFTSIGEIEGENEGHFNGFLGKHIDAYATTGLQWNIETYRERMPPELIPIGDGLSGDKLCLGVSGEYTGKIFYWDHTDEALHPDDYLTDYGMPRPDTELWRNVALVAESLEDFVERLFVAED